MKRAEVTIKKTTEKVSKVPVTKKVLEEVTEEIVMEKGPEEKIVETPKEIPNKVVEKMASNKDQIVDVTERRVWWKNPSGSFIAIIDGRSKMIKPGEKFMAYEREIPKGFRNTVYPTDPLPTKEPVVVVQSVFEAVPSETEEGKFDVKNTENGKTINGHPLEEKDAINLANSLNKK